MTTQQQPMLPGFELSTPVDNKLQQAAQKQLEQLQNENLLNDGNVILAQLVLELSSTVGQTIGGGKRLTIAGVQGAKLLLEALEALPRSESGSKMAAIVAELRAVS